MHTVETAKALRERLAAMGVNGAAADAIVKETAAARHAARVEQAKELLTTHARAMGASEEQAPAMGAALAALDAFGVGGTGKVEGAGSARYPGIGVPRKQSAAGPAWSAALEQAAREMAPGGVLFEPHESGSLFARAEGAVFALAPAERIGAMALLSFDVAGDWIRTVAREGLRRSLGLPWWFDRLSWVRFDGPPALWACVVNATEQALADYAAEPSDAPAAPMH